MTFDLGGREDEARSAVDDAYRAKYGRFGGSYLGPMLADQAAATILRLIPGD